MSLEKTSSRGAAVAAAFALVSALPGCGDHGSSPNERGQRAGLDFAGPHFPGAGKGGAGDSIAAGLDALSCGGKGNAPPGTGTPGSGARAHEICLFDAHDPDHVAGTVEWIVESADDRELVHVRLTLNPDFADNSYGANAIGWGASTPAPGPMPGPGGMPGMGMKPKPMGPHGHTFMDLVGSDHAEFKLSDADGRLAVHFDLDYISASAAAPSGYACLGVTGGEGKMILGSASDIVAASTSLDRDLNVCGYPDYLVDSPASDDDYTPNTATPNWDYRIVYDVWVKQSAFGSAGFGSATVDYVHASPSKAGSPSVDVTPGHCPPSWSYCDDPAGCACVPGPDIYCEPVSCPDGLCEDAGHGDHDAGLVI